MDRPGLTKLLADIAAGLIDIVVVYKADRLTRCLLKLAFLSPRLVEELFRGDARIRLVDQRADTWN